MPTTALTFAASQTRLRFREPYVSEGLNAKMAVTVPRGTYRGFKLGTSGTNRFVTVIADTDHSDHVAVYETSGGYSLTIKKDGGDFDIDLSDAGFNSKTVIIAIHATYAVNSTTAAYIKIYELSPSDEFTIAAEVDELIVLGKVIVPAGNTVIPEDDILPDYKQFAWQNTAPNAVIWEPLIRNSSFERGILNSTSKFAANYWEMTSLSGTTSKITSTTANTGLNSFEFALTSSGAKSGLILEQRINVPVKATDVFKVRFYIRCITAANAGGILRCQAIFRQSDGDIVGALPIAYVDTDIDATDASFRVVETTLQAGTSSDDIILLGSLQFEITATYGSSGTVAFRIDDVQCWTEQRNVLDALNNMDKERIGLSVAPLLIEDPASIYGDNVALVRFDGTTPASEDGSVIIERQDQDATAFPPALVPKGRLILGENLLDTEARSLKPRISTPYSVAGSTEYTLIWQSAPASGTSPHSRLYIRNNSGSIFFITNASWGGTNWTRDDTVDAVHALELSSSGFSLSYKASGVGTFTTFDQTTFSVLDAGSDSNFMSNTLDFGRNFNQVLPATQPRIWFQAYAIGTEDRTQLTENLAGDASNGHNRMYLTSTGNLEITKNCSWNGTAWERDFAANATKLLFDGSQFKLFIKLSADTGTPWNDASWGTTRGYTLDLSNSTLTNIDGIYKVTSATTGTGGSNPPSTTAITNELRAKNICRCWGRVTVSSGVATVVDGFNITSVTINSNNLRVTMASAVTDASKYIANATIVGTNFNFCTFNPVSTTVFDIQVVVPNTAAQLALSSNDREIAFTVWGEQ